MASFRKHGKVWYYRFVDGDGFKRERKGCTDRRATEDMARAAESKAAKIRDGTADPKDFIYRDHAARPLAVHIADWQAFLVSQGASSKHAEHASNRVRRLVAVMLGSHAALIDHRTLKPQDRGDIARKVAETIAPARLSGLTRETVQDGIARLKAAGWSHQSCNHYRASAKAFSKWCHESHRTREDAVRGVRGYNAKEDRRHDRRTVSLDELLCLISAAENGPMVAKMSGPARALCYRLAVASGLRYSEIASILPESFDWKAPSVTVAAAYTKNGDPATLTLPTDLASDLVAYVAAMPSGMPIFPLPAKGAKMLRVDLDAAGIPYQDASRLFFDFHSLRCQTATLADAAGVSPRVVQKMMRHSSLELTGRYTRPRAVDIKAAAGMLPSLKPEGGQVRGPGRDRNRRNSFPPFSHRRGRFWPS
jgi:integrase